MASNLATATTTQAARAPLVLVPVGSIEQHGPHLPLDTDTTIAVAVAEAVAATLAGHLPGTWVAPALSYGSSGEHQRSEEHTSELQSLMRISYAVFCLKKKKKKTDTLTPQTRNIQQ